MTSESTILSGTHLSARALPALGAVVLGLLLFLAAGFAGPMILHNATHDTRHALGLPCH